MKRLFSPTLMLSIAFISNAYCMIEPTNTPIEKEPVQQLEEKAPTPTELSPFDLRSINKRLSSIEFQGGHLQLEFCMLIPPTEGDLTPISHQTSKQYEDGSVQLELFSNKKPSSYELKKHIIIRYIVGEESEEFGQITFTLCKKSRSTGKNIEWTEITWPSLRNINLETLLFLVAMHEAYQENKSPIAMVLPIKSANRIKEIQTVLWKDLCFDRCKCPECKLFTPYDITKIQSYECKCRLTCQECKLPTPVKGKALKAGECRCKNKYPLFYPHLVFDFLTNRLTKILEKKGETMLNKVFKALAEPTL